MAFFRAPFFFLVAGDLRCSEAWSTLKTRYRTCVYPRIYVPLRNPPTETQQYLLPLEKAPAFLYVEYNRAVIAKMRRACGKGEGKAVRAFV